MGSLATTSGGSLAATGGGPVTVAVESPAAVGATTLALAQITVRLRQARRALELLGQVGEELTGDAGSASDMAHALRATVGEREGLDDLTRVGRILTDVVAASLAVVASAEDSHYRAAASNAQALLVDRQMRDLGADGRYFDSDFSPR